MIRVLIVDDHPIVRKGLRQTLEEAGDIVVAGEAGDAAEFGRVSAATRFDILLLDIALPGKSGMEILKDVRRVPSSPSVIILSNHSEAQYAIGAIKAGAAGYLSKVSAPEELVAAIRTVASGRRYVTASLAERMADLFSEDPAMLPHERLSEREREILRMIAEGVKPQEIAERLGISVKTVGTYRSRLLLKMNLSGNAELVRYAIEHGI